jgi:hypothetical protein
VGRYRRSDEIQVTLTATAKKGVKKAGDDRQAGRVVFKGANKNSSQFTLDSSYEDIEDEYESALELKRKVVKLQGHWFTAAVNSLEYANAFLTRLILI